MASRIRLIVQADDYGACPAITDGVLAGFRAGRITQASIMPPAPDSGRAAWLARLAGLPLGIHLTLACEWEGLRYYPLTPARSLRDQDGAFLPGVPELRARAEPEEALTELRAQVAAVRTAGVHPTHLESHVGVFDAAVLAQLSAETGLPCRDELPAPGRMLKLDSLWHLSVQPYADKVAALCDHVRRLPPGLHMIVAHPAVDSPELLTLTSPESRRWKWARDIRVTDLEALLSPEFGAACAASEVEPASLAVPVPPMPPAGRRSRP
jgi:predicted glycoside hydrolase/deacetylase ChbG (UPF0249 family)